jgi:hypothetical protein
MSIGQLGLVGPSRRRAPIIRLASQRPRIRYMRLRIAEKCDEVFCTLVYSYCLLA